MTYVSKIPLSLSALLYSKNSIQRYSSYLCCQMGSFFPIQDFERQCFSPNNPVFHLLTFKSPCRGSYKSWRSARIHTCMRTIFHYHTAKTQQEDPILFLQRQKASEHDSSTTQVTVLKCIYMYTQCLPWQWIVCIYKGKLSVLTL